MRLHPERLTRLIEQVHSRTGQHVVIHESMSRRDSWRPRSPLRHRVPIQHDDSFRRLEAQWQSADD